ncbi:MAG TPA: divergent polysaccharide deacetylase family protein [Thermoanaerobaculia bacterium]
MSGRMDGAHGSFKTIALTMAIPLAGLAIFFFWNWLHDGVTPKEAATEVVKVTTRQQARAVSAPASATTTTATNAEPLPEHPLKPLPAVRPRVSGGIVLIIDDLGFEGQPLERVMALDPNVNCSILPNSSRAAATAALLHSRGFELLCHLPMEPQGRERPGRDAVLTSMSDEEIERVTRLNVDAIPHARGVNNHMGSRATTDRRVMESVLRALPEGMYFIDSRTAGSSVAATISREMGVPTATRHVFLDDVQTEAFVRRQVAELAAVAEKKGVAIGIGHPHAVTLRVLEEELPALRARGLRLIRASEVVQ